MRKTLYDALEVCLRAFEQGSDLESCLRGYPDFEDELRPLLEATIKARSLAVSEIPIDVMRRGRTRLLQKAIQMREASPRQRQDSWHVFRAVAVAIFLALLFFVSGTGLVRASSGALPGDNLYPIKRTWEHLRSFIASEREREELEIAYKNERLEEIGKLFEHGRVVEVTFTGIVTDQMPDSWIISGVKVVIRAQTQIMTPITVGTSVIVTGETHPDGFVLAYRIEPLQYNGKPLPEFIVTEVPTETPEPEETETPEIEGTETPEPEETEEPEIEEAETPEPGETSEVPETQEPEDNNSQELSEVDDVIDIDMRVPNGWSLSIYPFF